jgi:hypothetical protein
VPSREYPRWAGGHLVPVIQDEDRSSNAIRDGFTSGAGYLAAKHFSNASRRSSR